MILDKDISDLAVTKLAILSAFGLIIGDNGISFTEEQDAELSSIADELTLKVIRPTVKPTSDEVFNLIKSRLNSVENWFNHYHSIQ